MASRRPKHTDETGMRVVAVFFEARSWSESTSKLAGELLPALLTQEPTGTVKGAPEGEGGSRTALAFASWGGSSEGAEPGERRLGMSGCLPNQQY